MQNSQHCARLVNCRPSLPFFGYLEMPEEGATQVASPSEKMMVEDGPSLRRIVAADLSYEVAPEPSQQRRIKLEA